MPSIIRTFDFSTTQPMKALLFPLLFLLALSAHAQVYSTTYTSGDISGPINFVTATPTSCPGTLVINNIPNGHVIDSVVMSYTFFTTLAGFQNVVNQRSYVACPTFSTSETQLTQPINPGPGTQVMYNRRVTIADGQTVNGPLTFIMYAGSADPLAFASCSNAQNVILNNTWTVQVHARSITSSCSVPTNLTASQVNYQSAQLSWTQPGTGTSQWEVAYGTAGTPFSALTFGLTNIPSFSLSNLPQATQHVAYVRGICGAGDTSNWSFQATFTTDTTPCLIPDSTWWFRRGNTTATIYWTPVIAGTAVNFEYGPAGFTRGTGTLQSNIQSDSVRVFNLQAIAYQYYYQVNCVLSNSSWAGPFSFNMSTVSVEPQAALVTKVYPQPARTSMLLELNQSVTYQLRNLVGHTLLRGNLEIGKGIIDVQELTPGIYFLELMHLGNVQVMKVIIGN